MLQDMRRDMMLRARVMVLRTLFRLLRTLCMLLRTQKKPLTQAQQGTQRATPPRRRSRAAGVCKPRQMRCSSEQQVHLAHYL